MDFSFVKGGEAIQEVVDEKSGVSDIRSATIIVFVYGLILYFFKIISKIPMSTTWVFIGLLAGRELAFAVRRRKLADGTSYGDASRMIVKDLVKVAIGFIVSLIFAVLINEHVSDAVMGTTECRAGCRVEFSKATKGCRDRYEDGQDNLRQKWKCPGQEGVSQGRQTRSGLRVVMMRETRVLSA